MSATESDLGVHCRAATPKDGEFLAEVLRQSEGGASGKVTYQRLFDLSDAELHDLLLRAQREEMEGCEMGYPNYVIAMVDGEPAGACAAWIEGAVGMPSNLIKANFLMEALGRERWKAARENLRLFSTVDIQREQGAMQLDAFAVMPNYQGYGITRFMIEQQRKRLKSMGYAPDKAQIIQTNTNIAARRAYEKAGFRFVRESTSSDPELQRFLTGNGKILLERLFDEE
jgi:ribosomal protein S18 acetylase RimI-like enzyme